MPNDDHEEAIKIIQDYLIEEFGISRDSFLSGKTSCGPIPDIFFRHPEDRRLVVVEVGATKAENIAKYLRNGHVREIRWYTRLRKDGVKLVALWHTDYASPVTINRQSCNMSKLKRKIERDLDNLNRGLHSKGMTTDSYVCCTGCGHPVQIKDLKVEVYRGREYGACSSCRQNDNFHTAGALEEAIALYDNINNPSLVMPKRSRPILSNGQTSPDC